MLIVGEKGRKKNALGSEAELFQIFSATILEI